jgi:hypothetical protein
VTTSRLAATTVQRVTASQRTIAGAAKSDAPAPIRKERRLEIISNVEPAAEWAEV